MGSVKFENILITQQKRIEVVGGDVMHALKASDLGFSGFGEAYFSIVMHGAIKGWKMHKRMTLNLIVPYGEVRFVFYDPDLECFLTEIIGTSNYVRLTVPPGIWFGFQGLAIPNSIILNVANIEHDPNEVMVKKIDDILYNWNP